MRENMGLYHGKRVDNGEWVEGYFFETNTPVYRAFIITNMSVDVSDNYTDILDFNIIEVDRETVGQHAGLTDKNGKKIFEGDILKQKTTAEFAKVNPFEWERYGIVRFGCYDWNDDYTGNTTMGWYIEHLKSVAIQPKNYCVGCIQHGLNQSDILDKYYPMEVIGNIHDNGDLLKGGAE